MNFSINKKVKLSLFAADTRIHRETQENQMKKWIESIKQIH